MPAVALELLDRIRSSYRFGYRLHWTGTKIPRGAGVKFEATTYPISWTQHGMVYGAVQSILGAYERSVEWGGPGKDEHEMLIATDGEVVPGEGMTVELIRDFVLEVPST